MWEVWQKIFSFCIKNSLFYFFDIFFILTYRNDFDKLLKVLEKENDMRNKDKNNMYTSVRRAECNVEKSYSDQSSNSEHSCLQSLEYVDYFPCNWWKNLLPQKESVLIVH